MVRTKTCRAANDLEQLHREPRARAGVQNAVAKEGELGGSSVAHPANWTPVPGRLVVVWFQQGRMRRAGPCRSALRRRQFRRRRGRHMLAPHARVDGLLSGRGRVHLHLLPERLVQPVRDTGLFVYGRGHRSGSRRRVPDIQWHVRLRFCFGFGQCVPLGARRGLLPVCVRMSVHLRRDLSVVRATSPELHRGGAHGLRAVPHVPDTRDELPLTALSRSDHRPTSPPSTSSSMTFSSRTTTPQWARRRQRLPAARVLRPASISE